MSKHDLGGLALSLLLFVLTRPGFAQQTIGLDECLAAAQKSAPSLTTTKLSLDNAAGQLVYSIGNNGLTLGASGGYSFEGNLPGAAGNLSSVLSSASSSSAVAGSNVKAALALSGPATSVGVSAVQGIPTSGTQSTALSLTGSQTVYDGYPGGRSKAAVSEAQYAFAIAQVTYDAALKSLSYQIKNDYYTLLGDQKSLVAREATVSQADEELKQMQGYLAAGRATTLDVLQVQVALTQAQLDLRTAQNTEKVDREKLSLAIGWALDRDYTVADVAAPQTPELNPDKALETAFKNRAELRTFELDISNASVDLALQKSQFSPTVSVAGSLGMAQAWSPGTLEEGIFTAGMSIALPPIYDGKQQESLVREKDDTLESVRVQEAQERQSIEIDVRNTLFSIQDASDRLDLAKQSLQEAQGVYDMQRAKFKAGSASALDVMTAFSSLSSAQVGLETAKSTYNLAILNLDNVEGL